MGSKLVGPVIQRRFNRREAIHRYYEPHKFKKHMLAYTEPYQRGDFRPHHEKCKGNHSATTELLPISKIYVEELLQDLATREFTLFLQHNYIPYQTERPYRNTITKSGGTFISHKNVVLKEVFLNRLGYDKLKNFFITRNSIVVGPLDKMGACVMALRKMPQFLLLAGLIDKEIVTHDQLQMMAAFSNIDQCRASLVATLETPAIDLAYYLDQHIKNSEGEEGTKEEQSPESPVN